jgi:hypothetical protein
MGLTVISYGRFYVALYLFEKLLLHDENDSFVFLFSYASLKFRVYIYTDYTYMVALASKQLFDDPVWVEHYERCVELFNLLHSLYLHTYRYSSEKILTNFVRKKISRFLHIRSSMISLQNNL